MICPRQRTSLSNRDAAAYTMVEMLVVITVVVGMAAMLLGAVGAKGSQAELIYSNLLK